MSDGRPGSAVAPDPSDPNPCFSPWARQIVSPAEEDCPAIYLDQELRKQWADKRLQAEGVRTLEGLPLIEGEAETRLRDPDAVADRFQALTLVAVKAGRMGYGDPRKEVQAFIERVVREREMRSDFSPCELAFILDPNPNERQLANFTWCWESAHVLAWALQLIDEPLGPPSTYCDTPRVETIASDAPDLTANGLRTTNDILNQADLAYRYHWAAFEDRQNADGLILPVAGERHQALNWLIRVGDADWDDVPTDT
jgi:hypothetical protein